MLPSAKIGHESKRNRVQSQHDDLQMPSSAGHAPKYCHVSPQPFVPSIFSPLIFENADSEARDHLANERTFLSYVRLSICTTMISIAIIISLNLKEQPTSLELRVAKPLGLIFCSLSLMCLALGLWTYLKTMTKYSQRTKIVQNGWITQSILTIIATSISGVCIFFLGIRLTN